MIGRVVHQRYEIVERISEEPLFQWFKARDRSAGRVVSVKLLQPIYAHDSAFADAVQRAALETVNLSHPNIASVLEVGKEDGEPYVIGEYVRGIDLKERVRRVAPFTLSVAVEIAIAIAEALQCAHAAGICHGDLRPQHVTVTAEGVVKVAEFGMGAALASSPQAHAANLAQAVYYQAPEVATGLAASIGTDIYALGVMLFEMVTGGIPYPGETPVSVAMKHQNDPVPSPRSLNPGVPRALEGIIMKAMQKRPSERYISCGDLLNDLRSVRDALRFGKPLSWTPSGPEVRQLQDAAPKPSAAAVPPRPAQDGAPVGQPGPRTPMTVPDDDRVSPILKVAIYSTVAIILIVWIIGTAYWFAVQSRPPDRRAPNLVGMKLDDARKALEGLGARIMTHEEYDDKAPAGVILRTDVDAGQMIRASQRINLWVSKGSRMVWVPDLTKLPKDDAVSKLSDAGLSLGEVNLQNSETVPTGAVIAQDPRAGRRVERNTPVNLTLSDGPKQPPADSAALDSGGGESGSPGFPSDTETLAPSSPDAATRADTFEFRVHVKPDGRGMRRVRILSTDAAGTLTVFDDLRSEGDDIVQPATVHGDRVRVRVYYGEDSKPVSDRVYKLGSGQ